MKTSFLPFLVGLGALIPQGSLFAENGNLALGASYRVPPPAGIQSGPEPGVLTHDGHSGDPIWAQEKTAVRFYAARPVGVTVDLKKWQPISGVSISTDADQIEESLAATRLVDPYKTLKKGYARSAV